MADKTGNNRKQSSSSWQYENSGEGITDRGMDPDPAMSCLLLKSKKIYRSWGLKRCLKLEIQ